MTDSHDSLEIKGDFIHQALSFKNQESCPILECVCACVSVLGYSCICVCVLGYVRMRVFACLCVCIICVYVLGSCVWWGNRVSSKVGGAGSHLVGYQGGVQRAWLKQKLVIDEANGPQ